MICSGRQTIIKRQMSLDDLTTVRVILEHLDAQSAHGFEISDSEFQVVEHLRGSQAYSFAKGPHVEFIYQESLSRKDILYIIGGGHCSLALSELASRLGFRITILDDRPELNTLSKNKFADKIVLLGSYEDVADHVPDGVDVYVAVMTLGYASDALVIRHLIDHRFKYFGVLGSKAKMATLMKELQTRVTTPRSSLEFERLSASRSTAGRPKRSPYRSPQS
jgi:xanthine dehydrogenase accessory factor